MTHDLLLFTPFIVCSIVVVQLAKRIHIVGTLGSQFVSGFPKILDQIIPLLHSHVSTFIRYCLSYMVMYTLIAC